MRMVQCDIINLVDLKLTQITNKKKFNDEIDIKKPLNPTPYLI